MPAAPTRSGHHRLAVVLDACHPWNTGGKERRHHEILTRLAAAGHRVDVYTMRQWDGPRSVEHDGIIFHAIGPRMALYAGSRRSILQAVVFALCTLRVVTRRFDVMEADAIPFLQLFPLRLVAWVRRRPMVVTWHEFWGRAYWVEYLGLLGHVAATFERIAVSVPDRVMAASVGTGRRLTELGPRGVDVRVVPNGADVRGLRDQVVSSTSADRSPRLISVGRLLDHKRVDAAVAAVGLLREAGGDHRLEIIGEGPERERLGDLVDRLQLGDVVTFSPFLPEHADVLARLADADVLLFPSTREGFGMAAIEAMAVGTPVVTSDHPDNFARDLVVDGVTGVVCRPEAAELAAAVRRVLSDQETMASAAVDAARDHDWDRIADQAATTYGLVA